MFILNKNEFTQKVLDAESTLYHVAKSILRSEADCEDAVQEAIAIAWQKLPKLRTVTVLYYVEGYCVKEVSELLTLPQGTVKSRLAAACQALRDILTESE